MKKTTLLLLLTCGLIMSAQAQSIQVGHTTVTFNDPSRTGGFGSGGGAGRQIQSEIYYPAAVAGNDVPVLNGTYPVIIFGHGFVMAWDAYQNIWDELVPEGYIIVFPRTEGGFSPSHDEFAMDLALLVNEMQLLNTDNSSLFYNHVDSKSAIMGHSMGGGSTMLAAVNNNSIETIVGLAPAETSPSAINLSSAISVPALIFSGSSDGVTPPQDHHIPIYDSLGSSCKYFISATGGAHCYFAEPNFNCDFGEGSASSGISITRAEQQTIMNNYLKPWFDFKLKGNCNSLSTFDSLLLADTDITYNSDCSFTSPIVNYVGNLSFCEGDSIELFSSNNLIWNTGAVGNFIYASQSGDYFGYDSNCQQSNTITVTVNSSDSINQTVTICPGETFTVGSSNYTTDGVYTDILMNEYGCDSIVTTHLTVNSNLGPIASQNGTTLTTDLSGLNYQWIDCSTNTIISGATNQTFSPNSNGNYAVIVTSGSCADTSNCVSYTTTAGMNNLEENTIQIYPNPSSGLVKIKSTENIQLDLYLIDGQYVKTLLIQEETVHKLELLDGIYLVQITTSDGWIKTEKLIIAQ